MFGGREEKEVTSSFSAGHLLVSTMFGGKEEKEVTSESHASFFAGITFALNLIGHRNEMDCACGCKDGR